MSEPTDKPQRRRKKKLTREERAKRAEYMKKYRKGAPPEIASPQPPPTPTDGTPQPVAQAEPSAPPGLTLEKKIALVKNCMAGVVQAGTDIAQLLLLDGEAPHFGRERALNLGELWAPIIAPMLSDNQAEWLPYLFAIAGTTNAAYAWAHDYKQFRAEKEKRTLRLVGEAQAS